MLVAHLMSCILYGYRAFFFYVLIQCVFNVLIQCVFNVLLVLITISAAVNGNKVYHLFKRNIQMVLSFVINNHIFKECFTMCLPLCTSVCMCLYLCICVHKGIDSSPTS